MAPFEIPVALHRIAHRVRAGGPGIMAPEVDELLEVIAHHHPRLVAELRWRAECAYGKGAPEVPRAVLGAVLVAVVDAELKLQVPPPFVVVDDDSGTLTMLSAAAIAMFRREIQT